MNRPEVISIGMVWDSERPPAEQVAGVYAALGTELRPAEGFHACLDRSWAERASLRLVGLVTYYGKHYSTFFYHTKLRLWIYFDDADVKEVGPEWSQVVDKCVRGRFQPLLVLYAAADGTPCDTRHAPRDVVPYGTRRAVTPAPPAPVAPPGAARRALTPSPDCAATRRAPLARSLSTGSGSEGEVGGRTRRDSGNWSGDRNSASSGSSTADSPYLYARVRHPPSLPPSPTRKGELSSGGSCDAGYDSYSLSSTDSLSLQQGLRHNLQLAQIPLFAEVDRLMETSRHPELAGDLETALMLCETAAARARAAIDAPYNNPHTIAYARMKHNACVTRVRYLQRRAAAIRPPDLHLAAQARQPKVVDSFAVPIEIYATLPKKKGGSKKSPKVC